MPLGSRYGVDSRNRGTPVYNQFCADAVSRGGDPTHDSVSEVKHKEDSA